MACRVTRALRPAFLRGKYFHHIQVAQAYLSSKPQISASSQEGLIRGRNVIGRSKFSTENQNEQGDVREKVIRLSEKFSEARELLDDAMNSKDSVYFNDDMETASQALDQLFKDYSSLIRSLSEEQRRPVQEKFDDRMEELKSHRKSIINSLRDL